MKILVFSDSHLDQNFEPKKFAFLKRLIESVDQVVINGDFWEGYSMSFNEFLKSPWKELFPLLKRKNTVYVFGNHDKDILSDKRINRFCTTSSWRYKLRTPNYTYVFEHGNRLTPYLDDIWKMKTLPKPLNVFLGELEELLVRFFDVKGLTFLFGRFNDVVKEKLKKELKKNEILVCGHTHVAELDLKARYINNGIMRHGLAHHLIITNGIPTLHRERYR